VSTTSEVDEPVRGPIDGRTARAVRTREALVDATIALVEEGDARPTAPRIAERAGVSVRSVFQHFADLETLFAAMGVRVFERLAVLVSPIDPDLPLAERVAEFVRQRTEVCEAVTPINRAAMTHAPTSKTINRQFRAGHGFTAAQIEETFGAELRAVGDRRDALADALLVATSWSTWNLLRSLEDRSVPACVEAVARLVDLAFAGAGVDGS
jgi:TetR/AcrR family transcriptional regulator, regulator of autoinduction and epiphytic fitness